MCHYDAMDLTPYVEDLRHELAVAADAGGDAARELAARLTAPLESATRLTLLNALSAAMDEVTRDLAPGSVDVRLRGLDPEFVVTPPPAPEAYQAPPPAAAATAPSAEGDDGSTARINVRLAAHLKSRVESAAAAENLSVNAWVVRAVTSALDGPQEARGERRAGGSASFRIGGQGFTGWVR
jgi:hypothetical protein